MAVQRWFDTAAQSAHWATGTSVSYKQKAKVISSALPVLVVLIGFRSNILAMTSCLPRRHGDSARMRISLYGARVCAKLDKHFVKHKSQLEGVPPPSLFYLVFFFFIAPLGCRGRNAASEPLLIQLYHIKHPSASTWNTCALGLHWNTG